MAIYTHATTPAILLLALAVAACRDADPRGTTSDTAPMTDTGPTPKSVVWITIDTTRTDRLGLHGYGLDTTPRLAEWAQTATVFDHALSHAPWTKASMATLFTSTLPDVHGVTVWEEAMDPAQPTVALELKAAGYATEAYVGHSAFLTHENTFHLGFDVFDLSSWKGIDSPTELVTSEAITESAVAALTRLQGTGEPYLLWVHYFDPHATYLPHDGHDFGPSDSELYDGEISFTDAHLGQLLDVVDAQADDTVVVINADHGEEFRDHGGLQHSRTLYDELVRVPLLVRAPGCAPGRLGAAVGLVDVAPTVLDLLGRDVPETFAGQSLLGPSGCPSVADDRTILLETRFTAELRGSFDGRYKVIRDETDGSVEIYDLGVDPLEQTDLAGSDAAFDAERLADVEARYGVWGSSRR